MASLGTQGIGPVALLLALGRKYRQMGQALPYGSSEDVERETLELVEHLGPQGGVLIGSSSEIHDLVPAENTLRMYETVHRFGQYPITHQSL